MVIDRRTSIFWQDSRFSLMGSKIIVGGALSSTRISPRPKTYKYYQSHRSSGASPQALGRPVGQTVRGDQPGNCWNPVRRQPGRQPVKVHCP